MDNNKYSHMTLDEICALSLDELNEMFRVVGQAIENKRSSLVNDAWQQLQEAIANYLKYDGIAFEYEDSNCDTPYITVDELYQLDFSEIGTIKIN